MVHELLNILKNFVLFYCVIVSWNAIFRRGYIEKFRVHTSMCPNVAVLRLFPSITLQTVSNLFCYKFGSKVNCSFFLAMLEIIFIDFPLYLIVVQLIM